MFRMFFFPHTPVHGSGSDVPRSVPSSSNIDCSDTMPSHDFSADRVWILHHTAGSARRHARSSHGIVCWHSSSATRDRGKYVVLLTQKASYTAVQCAFVRLSILRHPTVFSSILTRQPLVSGSSLGPRFLESYHRRSSCITRLLFRHIESVTRLGYNADQVPRSPQHLIRNVSG